MSTLTDLLHQIDMLKAELDDLRPLSFENAQRLRSKLNLEWNYHSNAIEGNTLTLGETRAFLYHGLTARGKPFKDYLDIKGHKAAIEHVEAIVRDQHPLTEADIRYLHQLLLIEPYEMPAQRPDGTPTTRTIRIGEYKSMPNSVLTSTGELHTYASPEETPAKMGDLMRWYREEAVKAEFHPVVIAALFHYRFVAIHPFDDGNGRMARLLMNLSLMQSSYVPVVIKIEQRENYLLSLAQADADDTQSFIEFIAELEIDSLSLTLKAARGESLEEPDDLDKRLLILRQQLQGSNDKRESPTPEDAARIGINFTIPFLERLAIQLPKFDQFFQKAYADITIEPETGIFVEPPTISDFPEIIKNRGIGSEELHTISTTYTWSGFIENIETNLELYLLFDFRNRNNFVCKWGLHEQKSFAAEVGRFPMTLIDVAYTALGISDDEVEAKVTIITNEIFSQIEKFAELGKQ